MADPSQLLNVKQKESASKRKMTAAIIEEQAKENNDN